MFTSRDARKYCLNSRSSGMWGSTNPPPANTVRQDFRLRSSSPREPR